MSDSWDDPAAWRDAMLPPLSFAEALKAARKARASRFVWRGATFDLSEPAAKEPATMTELEAWKAKHRARQA
jgi:hypothetical protein